MFENLSLNEACKEQHKMVVAKGFTRQPIATNLMLIAVILITMMLTGCMTAKGLHPEEQHPIEEYELYQTGYKVGFEAGRCVAFDEKKGCAIKKKHQSTMM